MKTKKIFTMAIIVAALIVVALMLNRGAFKFDLILQEMQCKYTAVVYAEKGYGTPKYQTAAYGIGSEKCYKLKGDYSRGYTGFYADGVHDKLASMGKNEDYGQLMFHDEYAIGEIFIFDNWSAGATKWQVFLIVGEELQEFEVDKHDAFDSLNSYSISEDSLYLHIYTNDGRTVLAKLDFSDKSVVKKEVLLSDIGMKISEQRGTVNWFDIRNDSMIFALKRDSENIILCYSFANKSHFETKVPGVISNVFSTPEGYQVISKSMPNQIVIYNYDQEFKLLDEKHIALKLDTEKLGNNIVHIGTGYLEDNKYYGIVSGDHRMYYYVADVESAKVLALTKLDLNNKFTAQAFKIYNAGSAEQPMPNLY